MHLLPSLPLTLAVACCTGAALAGESTGGETLATMRVDGTITVDERGRVASHRLPADLSPPLRSIIDRAIADWSFHPPTIDGKPSAATGKMRITLSARHHGDDYAVRVDNVTFSGSSKMDRGMWQAEPMGILRHSFRSAGALSVHVRIAPDGTILDAFASQCSLYAWKKKRQTPEAACAEFEKYGLALAFKLKLHDPAASSRDSTPPPETATMPLVFQWADEERPGEWRGEWRTPYRRAPWLAETAPRVGASDLKASDGLIQNSGDLRLLTDLAAAKP